VSQIVFVNKGGNDVTGDGTAAQPFLTIGAAMDFIVDADKPKRYAILVGPGQYDDPIVVKPWIWVVATAINTTLINGAITLSTLWNPMPPFATDVRGGWSGVVFLNAFTYDYNAVASNEGKVDFFNCAFDGPPNFIAFSSINQYTFNACRFFAGFSQTGGQSSLGGCFMQNGSPIVLTSKNDGSNTFTNMEAFGGGTDGSISATYTPGPGNRQMQIILNAFGVDGEVTLDGALIQYFAGPEGIPLVEDLTLSNGAPTPIQTTGSYTLPFQYTAVGGETTTIVVTIPLVQPDTNFTCGVTQGDVVSGIKSLAVPPSLYTTTTVTLLLSAAPAVGESFEFQLTRA
jgi:hypothetical protein